MSGEILSGDLLSGVVETLNETGSILASSGFLEGSLISSPSTFRYWLLGILKKIGLWCLGYWYVPVIVVVVYCALLYGYNVLRDYLLKKLQKKNVA